MAPTATQRSRSVVPPRLLVPFVLLATVLVGMALSLLPTTSSSLPSTTSPTGFPFAHAKHLPASALRYLPKDLQPTYWADKRNVVNRVFVKVGWGWTTLAVFTVCGLIITFSSPEGGRPPAEADGAIPAVEVDRAVGKSRAKRGGWKGLLKRYGIVTLGWILTTQSFPLLYSAPPLSDRLLLFTGAKCVAALGDVASISPVPVSPILGPGKNGEDAGSVRDKPEWGLVRPGEVELPQEYCVKVWGRRPSSTDKKLARQHKPYWYGGTDLSGHAFLLSLGVLLLVDSLRTLLAAPLSLPSSSSPAAAAPTTPGSRRPTPAVVLVALIATSFLTVLWWWMLLMTSLHFHGPLEKLLGVGSALAWWAVADGLTSSSS